jgi:hypothetical protein
MHVGRRRDDPTGFVTEVDQALQRMLDARASRDAG